MVAKDVEKLRCNLCGKNISEEDFEKVQDDAEQFTDEEEDIWVMTVLIFMATKKEIYRHKGSFVVCADCVVEHMAGARKSLGR